MAIYRIEFVDSSGNVSGIEKMERTSDDEAVEAALFIYAPRLGSGFDVWDGDRLVHRHRDYCRSSSSPGSATCERSSS
jgi:hypothetical protein